MDNQEQPTVSGKDQEEPAPPVHRPEGEDLFGARLRQERERRNLTQADVAQLLERHRGIKLHPSAIAKMETRDVDRPRTIRLNEATAIASLFNLTVDEMLEPTEDAFEEAADLAQRLAELLDLAQHTRAEFFERLRDAAPFGASESVGVRRSLHRIHVALDKVLDFEAAVVDRFDDEERMLAEAFPDWAKTKTFETGGGYHIEIRDVEGLPGHAYFIFRTDAGDELNSVIYATSQEAHMARRRVLHVLRRRWQMKWTPKGQTDEAATETVDGIQ